MQCWKTERFILSHHFVVVPQKIFFTVEVFFYIYQNLFKLKAFAEIAKAGRGLLNAKLD